MKCIDYILLSARNVAWREHVIAKNEALKVFLSWGHPWTWKNESNIKSLLLRSGEWQVVISGSFNSAFQTQLHFYYLCATRWHRWIDILTSCVGKTFCRRLRHFNTVQFVFTRERKCDSSIVSLIYWNNWFLITESIVTSLFIVTCATFAWTKDFKGNTNADQTPAMMNAAFAWRYNMKF